MTQDDKPQGLMSAEALASIEATVEQGDWCAMGVSVVNSDDVVVAMAITNTDAQQLVIDLNSIPRLLAHIAAQDERYYSQYDRIEELEGLIGVVLRAYKNAGTIAEMRDVMDLIREATLEE